jgi:hypothetical protein
MHPELKRRAMLAAQLAICLLVEIAPLGARANYPLQIMHPRQVGTSADADGPKISAHHRVFWAYPDIEYNIRPAVIGGAYPYTYRLSNAAPGMTIDADTGVISWIRPQRGIRTTPTLTVTDSDGALTSSTWTIHVTPEKFLFVDAVNGKEFDAAVPGTGTIDNPFKRLRDLYSGSTVAAKSISTNANKIVYFKQGTYLIDGFLEDVGAYDGYSLGRMPMADGVKPVAWLAYPGQQPVLDGRCVAAARPMGPRPCNRGAHVAFYGPANNVYWDGLKITNIAIHGVRTEGAGSYQVFRRGTWTIQGPTVRGANAGMITFSASGGAGSAMGAYTAIQDNVFSDIDGGMCVEIYSVQRLLIEDNVCHTVYSSNGTADDGGVFIKGGEMERVTVRGNTFHNMARRAIAGNMLVLRSAEILFNRVYGIHNVKNFTAPINYDPVALEVNQNGAAGVVHIRRNTFVGRVVVRNTDAADGPFYFSENVIVNTDPGPHISFDNVSAPARVVIGDNFTARPDQKAVDAEGNLVPAQKALIGRRGHQKGSPSRR